MPGGRLREKHSLHSETPFQCKIQLLGCDLLSKQVVCSLDKFQKLNILNDINHQNLWSLYPLLVAKQTEGQISSSSSPPYMGPTSALVRTSVCARNCPIHFNHPTPNHIFFINLIFSKLKVLVIVVIVAVAVVRSGSVLVLSVCLSERKC